MFLHMGLVSWSGGAFRPLSLARFYDARDGFGFWDGDNGPYGVIYGFPVFDGRADDGAKDGKFPVEGLKLSGYFGFDLYGPDRPFGAVVVERHVGVVKESEKCVPEFGHRIAEGDGLGLVPDRPPEFRKRLRQQFVRPRLDCHCPGVVLRVVGSVPFESHRVLKQCLEVGCPSGLFRFDEVIEVPEQVREANLHAFRGRGKLGRQTVAANYGIGKPGGEIVGYHLLRTRGCRRDIRHGLVLPNPKPHFSASQFCPGFVRADKTGRFDRFAQCPIGPLGLVRAPANHVFHRPLPNVEGRNLFEKILQPQKGDQLVYAIVYDHGLYVLPVLHVIGDALRKIGLLAVSAGAGYRKVTVFRHDRRYGRDVYELPPTDRNRGKAGQRQPATVAERGVQIHCGIGGVAHFERNALVARLPARGPVALGAKALVLARQVRRRGDMAVRTRFSHAFQAQQRLQTAYCLALRNYGRILRGYQLGLGGQHGRLFGNDRQGLPRFDP